MKNSEYSNEIVLEILKRVNENLSLMNTYTDNILICSYDDMEENIEKRNVCFESVKKDYEKLNAFRTDENNVFKDIMSFSILKVPEEYTDVYNERLKMKDLLDSIISKDDLLNEKIKECKEEMLLRIKSLNSGNEAKASKYNMYVNKNSGNIYLPKKNKQI